MKFETVRIHFLSDVLVCCHPEILLPSQRDVTTSPLYCLCFTRRGWPCDFPPKKPRVAFGLPYLLIELFYICIPVAGRAAGRTVT